jgi:hypothetical protein
LAEALTWAAEAAPGFKKPVGKCYIFKSINTNEYKELRPIGYKMPVPTWLVLKDRGFEQQ